MPFNQTEVEQLLADTGRRCCICKLLHHVSVHHIDPSYRGGSDHIDNAIPLCPTCHDVIHTSYSPGRSTRSYTPNELRLHRQHTIELARMTSTPGLAVPAISEVGDTAHTTSASSECEKRDLARGILRTVYSLRDAIQSARIPATFGGESEAGRRILEAAGLPFEGKSVTELVWTSRWNPIRELTIQLNDLALEAEVIFGNEARTLIWELQALVGRFGVDVNMYVSMNSSLSERRGMDPVRMELYKNVFGGMGSSERDEVGEGLSATLTRIEAYLRTYIL